MLQFSHQCNHAAQNHFDALADADDHNADEMFSPLCCHCCCCVPLCTCAISPQHKNITMKLIIIYRKRPCGTKPVCTRYARSSLWKFMIFAYFRGIVHLSIIRARALVHDTDYAARQIKYEYIISTMPECRAFGLHQQHKQKKTKNEMLNPNGPTGTVLHAARLQYVQLAGTTTTRRKPF